MPWDPERYLAYADLRARPGLELLTRIPDLDPRIVVDLGSGTGNLTAVIAERWPDAAIAGVDSSPEMIERAKADHPDVDWQLASIDDWEPSDSVDLIFSNATLHWLDDHAALFSRLRSYLGHGGVLAVQMPDNWVAPTHVVPKDILDHGDWPDSARNALLRDRLSPVDAYRSWLQPAEVDIWRTTYFQTLAGEDPVWRWVTGSVLRPVLALLDESDRARFEDECRTAYRDAYPPNDDGTTTLPFSRLFLVARAR